MAKRLYVGSLPYSTNDQQLMELFAQAGQVQEVKIIIDRFSGRSKGFGFVEMVTEEEAQKAIEMFNGYSLDGRTLVVNEARQEERTNRSDGDRGGNRGFSRGGGYSRRD